MERRRRIKSSPQRKEWSGRRGSRKNTNRKDSLEAGGQGDRRQTEEGERSSAAVSKVERRGWRKDTADRESER